MLSRRAKRTAGFTLVETTLVLALLGTTLLIGIYRFPSRQQQFLNEQLFWQRLNTTWKLNVYLASSQRSARNVWFRKDGSQHYVDFTRQPVAGEDPQNTVPTRIYLPKTMKIVQLPQTGNNKGNRIRIETTGHPSLATVKLKSNLTGEVIKITTQMGWGAYHVAKTTK